MRALLMTAVVLTVSMTLGACQSTHQKGVTSNYRTQWTMVGADVKATTTAAKAVLTEDGLDDVKSNSTNVDGTASGKKSDGSMVNVSVKKEKETTSQVSVTVGKIGEPALGADIARRIKDRAEGSAGGVKETTTRQAK